MNAYKCCECPSRQFVVQLKLIPSRSIERTLTILAFIFIGEGINFTAASTILDGTYTTVIYVKLIPSE